MGFFYNFRIRTHRFTVSRNLTSFPPTNLKIDKNNNSTALPVISLYCHPKTRRGFRFKNFSSPNHSYLLLLSFLITHQGHPQLQFRKPNPSACFGYLRNPSTPPSVVNTVVWGSGRRLLLKETIGPLLINY